MTAEILHDAITLLPSDLIAQADKKRNAGPKIIPWRRYAAMAACFAVVLGCSLFALQLFRPKGTAESMMAADFAAPQMQSITADAPVAEAAPMEPVRDEAAAEEADTSISGSGNAVCEIPAAEPEEPARYASDIFCQRVETPLKPSTACFSSTTVTLLCSQAELERYMSEKDWIYDLSNFPTACEDYDESWFAEHDLLVLTIHAAYPDVPYTVTAIEDVRGKDPMGWDWFVHFSNHGTDCPDQDLTTFHLLAELEKDLISPEDSILSIAEVPPDS